MKIKDFVIFAAGAMVGCAGGVFGAGLYFKKKFEVKADEEIASMEKYYKSQMEELVSLVGDDTSASEDQVVKISGEEQSEIKKKLVKNYEQTTNYAQAYKAKSLAHKEGDEWVLDDPPVFDEEFEDDGPQVSPVEADIEESGENHKANRNRPPRIISVDDLEDVPAYYDQKTLFYYTIDEALTDEEDELVDEPALLLGDCLDKYNFRESDEKVIFVQNFALDTIYEVTKVVSSYE